MNTAQKNYSQLQEISRKNRILEGVSSLIGWDQETYMPAGSAGIRAEQTELLAGLIHQGKTSKKFANALGKLVDLKSGKIKSNSLKPPQKAALRAWHRDYIQATALPTKFVEEMAKLTSQALEVWRVARQENAFGKFAPFLEKIIVMNRRKADYLGYKDHPYDALLDIYEPEMTTKEVGSVFGKLRKNVSELVKQIQEKKQVDDRFIHGKFSQAKQLAFAHELLEGMHYDMDKGRLDLSTHPFSSAAHPTDSRITTRIHPTSLMSIVATVLHEAGHGMYEMGLPTDQYGTPLCESISLGVHESQSRLWETLIGLSKPFWKHYLPVLRKYFPKLKGITLDQFYRGINKVEPSLIRVEADEVTYPLHVILRFEIETALIEGTLSVRDLPEAWNAKMEELLGVVPKDNRQGCLQDIHWSMGAFGYFPTYALGNLYAAQIFESFAKDHPDWEKRLSKGELLFVKEWLHNAVYQHGRRYTSKELLKKISGKVFSAQPYAKYLSKKYGEIYRLT